VIGRIAFRLSRFAEPIFADSSVRRSFAAAAAAA
jgi:hypothetical protein